MLSIPFFGSRTGHSSKSSLTDAILPFKTRSYSDVCADNKSGTKAGAIVGNAAAGEKGSVNLRITSEGKKTFEVKIPGLFRSSISLAASYRGPEEFEVRAHKPFRLWRNYGESIIRAGKYAKCFNDRNIGIERAEASIKSTSSLVSVGGERLNDLVVFYTQCTKRMLGFDLFAKVGAAREDRAVPFLKGILSRRISLSAGPFFADTDLKIGQILGRTNVTEKFLLGSRTRGYKPESISPVSQKQKIGGNSFLEMRNRVGVGLKGLEAFLFADVSACSAKDIRESFKILREFGSGSCIGKSVGCGLSLRDGRGISFVYSYPLTDNKEVEKYSLEVDFTF